MKDESMSSMERFHTAVRLKEADRVPIAPLMDYYYANCAGITAEEYVFGDFKTAANAVKTTYKRHGGDLDMVHIPIGRVYAYFEPFPAAHSGFYSPLQVPDTIGGSLQFVEEPILDISEFDLIYEEGFSRLWQPLPIDKVRRTQIEFLQIIKFMDYWENRMHVPLYTLTAIITPLETLSYLCGIQKWSRYIHKNTEEMKEMCDFMIKGLIANDLFLKKLSQSRSKHSYVCLERVSASFISPKVFEELVLPYLKQIVEVNNKLGYINLFHMDTDWTPFFEYFLELPKGRYILHLENSDIFKAKELLGDRFCLMGNVNSTLQKLGTPQQIEDYCKKLIEVCGEGGGYILGSGCEIASDAPFENVQAIVNAGKKYGVYRK
ncbi:MAG TPA: uroporphyrinogen decarboxylase family protein [Candidatus Deferrimicrobium sp.]|nr:uroporphyrinogen decarboxylase family protein [Candidatus Deferrimicrobium sp.]